MHIDWQRVCEYVYANRLPITGVGSLVLTAGVRTMPERLPRSVDDFWTWAYDWAHTFWNLKNDRATLSPGK